MLTGCNSWNEGLDVMVEGEARQVTDRGMLERLAAAWATKWNGEWQYRAVEGGFADTNAVEPGGVVLVFEVKASKVLAFGKGPFSHTRYRLSP